MKLDITMKHCKVPSHCSVLFCMADWPLAGYKHLKKRNKRKQ